VLKKLLRRTIRLALVAAVAALVARLVADRSGSASGGPKATAPKEGLFPSIGGDTWPPVPTAPTDRAG
jgi:hypothetical protein